MQKKSKDMADVKLQLCTFAITITMETKDHGQRRGESQENGCIGPSSAVMFLGTRLFASEDRRSIYCKASGHRSAPQHIVDAESYCHRLAL